MLTEETTKVDNPSNVRDLKHAFRNRVEGGVLPPNHVGSLVYED